MAVQHANAFSTLAKIDVVAISKKEREVLSAKRELVALRQETAGVLATLQGLRAELVQTQDALELAESIRLVEANEQLVRAALHARSEAEASARALDELSRSTEFDALTGLPNRARLFHRFSTAFSFAKRHGTKMALLFLDLNNFKQINDTLGHGVGDEVLKLIAERLALVVRDEDTVCRYGGDEFVILLAEVSDPSDARLVADKLTAVLGAPCRIGEHVFRLSACIGICICPDDGVEAKSLIECADAAMYKAKHVHAVGSSLSFHGKEHSGRRHPRSPALESLQRPFTHSELAAEECKRQNGQLREANTELVLAALGAKDLQSAAERLHKQQKESLALVAHELRNPLAPIRIATEMMGLVGPEDIPRYQTIVENEVEHMVRLISDLLDMSRINTGKLRIEKRAVDLARVIEEAANACRPAMDARLQRFSVQIPAHTISLDADPVRLAQILRNLLDNASKYTPNGGEIGLSVAVVDQEVIVKVSDSGIGMTAEVLPEVFEPFVQDTHAVVFNGAGMGIGLTVVRELIAAHGGSVEAHSKGAGLGSEFLVTLPLATPGRRDALQAWGTPHLDSAPMSRVGTSRIECATTKAST